MTPWRYTRIGQLLRLEFRPTRTQQALIVIALTLLATAAAAFIVAGLYGQIHL